MSEMITTQALRTLVGEWLDKGRRVAGPSQVKPDLVSYTALATPDQLVLDGFIHPSNSIKEFFFPRHERLYGYRIEGRKVELSDPPAPDAEQVIIAARPCDAAALPILDKLFNWDSRDEFYNRRRAATTIVTLACSAHDSACFCTSVGLAPDATNGSDAMLVPAGEGRYEVRALTDKGRALFEGKTEPSTDNGHACDGPPARFDANNLRDFLRGNFESPVWAELTLRCLGCGTCAYVCPTCHCFDIDDQGACAASATASAGARMKNWDSCQFRMFTQHASGHNPRANQAQRQRQRIMHKFFVYPERFGAILCTGCGNCTRACPVSLGVAGVLEGLK
ncbi:4Fe-4S dicluster domain-containing protein [bacterium]|nr:4Fe-4S dicluster domain-containing protein [bacterium]